MPSTRRRLIRGGALSALLATLGPGIRVGFGAPAASGAAAPVLIVLTCLGAQDGLSLVSPTEDPNLIAARTADTRLVSSGAGAAILLGSGAGPAPVGGGAASDDWHIHPGAPELAALYAAGRLAIVHAAGSILDSRSHADMTDRLEAGVPVLGTSYTVATGWIGRYLAATAGAGAGLFAGVSTAGGVPAAFRGFADVQYLPDVAQFDVATGRKHSAARTAAIQAGYASRPSAGPDALLRQGASDTLAAVAAFQAAAAGYVSKDSFGAGSWQKEMSVVAELVKLDIGVQVVQASFDGWDTHSGQQAFFADKVPLLSQAVSQLYAALSGAGVDFTLVTMTEFGRRVAENADGGTDHGHANVMLVAGPRVRGGRILGRWPGLAPASLDDGDLRVTTENRAVLAEILASRGRGVPAGVFPGMAAPAPLGLYA